MRTILIASTATLALVHAVAAHAGEREDRAPVVVSTETEPTEPQTAQAAPKEVFSTGMAKGRDRLDSATSTSVLPVSEVQKIGGTSPSSVLRAIAGIRVEGTGDEATSSFTIRGLPNASGGAKFLQFQEDGLPVLEFGDISGFGAEMLVRPDLMLAQVETIRGGSASTFASNSPGGIINFLSKTGETEGGAVQISSGLNYGMQRADFDYGGRLSSSIRFQVGGYYRSGEGPRDVGFNAFRGGQFRFNVTKEFSNGYIRLLGKLLDDRSPAYNVVAMRATGSDADPSYSSLTNLNAKTDSMQSRYTRDQVSVNSNGGITAQDFAEGMHAKAKSIGTDMRFEIDEWTISGRGRYSSISYSGNQQLGLLVAPAQALANTFGGPGATLRYGNGPLAGQAITNPATLNGNGALASTLMTKIDSDDASNFVGDIRASRVWKLGQGDLTFTAGTYKSWQRIAQTSYFNNIIRELNGVESARVDIISANGVSQTQGGVLAYSVFPVTPGGSRKFSVDYDINAPYGSLNYQIGKLSIGGSVRYDMGKVNGVRYGGELRGIGTRPIDINGNGVISAAETRTNVLPMSEPSPVDYSYSYLSYSTGINYRIAEQFAAFVRYSRGGRAAADRILYTPGVRVSDGGLTNADSAYDEVKQAEAGVKFRNASLSLNLTGFYAKTGERNFQLLSRPDGSLGLEQIVRQYKAYGAEVEGSYRTGAFSITGSATYTKAEIDENENDPSIVGNTPRRQPSLIGYVMPQYNSKLFTIGATASYTGDSYAQDVNRLKMPAYTLIGAFLQVRPVERVELMLNVANLFDTMGIVEVSQATLPASGLVFGRATNGRTLSASARLSF